MNLRRTIVRALATGAALAVAGAALAQQSSGVRLDVNLKDADMMTATRMLFQRTGIQFVVKPTTKQYARITLKLDNVTAEEAVRYICQAAGAYFQRDELGVFIISGEPPVEPAAPVVPPAPVKRTFRRIQLVATDAQDVYRQVMYSIPFSTTRGFEELKRFNKMSAADTQATFNATTAQIYGQQITTPRFDISSPTVAPTLPQNDVSNGIQLPGEAANQIGGGRMGGGGGMGGGMMGGGQGGGVGGGLGGGLGGGQGGLGGGAQLIGGQGLVPASIDFISYDPTTNSLLVRGNDDDINTLQRYIAELDKAPRQVQVKVEFISVGEGFSKALGYEFLYQRGSVFAGTRPGVFASSSNPVFLNYATGNVAGRLRAALSTSNNKVEQAPIIRTLNNQPATVVQSTQRWAFIPQTALVAGAGAINNFIPQAVFAFSTLSVTPRINGDGTITMFLAPQISGFQGNSIGPDGTTLPDSFTQFISVVARVRNGETIALGGLTTKNEDNQINKVPVLADIPIIGQFFRSVQRTRTQTELIIFVTPTVLDEDDTAPLGGPLL